MAPSTRFASRLTIDNIMRNLNILATILLLPWNINAGEPFKPGKLPAADVAALQQGLTLRFYKPGDVKSLDARRVRLAALHVPKGEAPSPFVAPGPFAAKFTGYLKNPLKGDYSFRLVGAGDAVLKINDKVFLKYPQEKDKEITVELAKNYNKLEIDFVAPKDGDATLRLYWAGEKFGFEPVPPEVLFSRGDEKDLVEQSTLREGRQLFANRHCASCHDVPEAKNAALPELHLSWEFQTPRLDNLGDRFNADWLAAWILNPRHFRPDATMPKVLAGADAEKNAVDIAAYLTFFNFEKFKPLSNAPKAATGEAIFKRLACDSCHRLDAPESKDDLGRLSLHHVGAKFLPNTIAHFLKEPQRRYEWTRMPDFKLSDDEAAHLEAYLRENAKGVVKAIPKGDEKRGGDLFREARCASCHTHAPGGVKIEGRLPELPIKKYDGGCLALKDRGKAPDLVLDDAQRNALTSFLKSDRQSLQRDTAAEFSLRQVQALQCASCHRRDGAMTRWHAVLEDEGKEPEKLPSLTWVGEKLKPEWTEKMLAGRHDHRARPWIKARMPAFPARARILAVGLSHEHGFGVNEDERPKPDAKLAAIGEKLVPQQGGFNCNNCHGIGKTPAIQPFEAPGINLVDAAVRLRYAYYQRWMLAPDRVDVTMRMPVFAMDGKTTQIRDVFDGDAHKQFDALWHYIQTLPAKNP